MVEGLLQHVLTLKPATAEADAGLHPKVLAMLQVAQWGVHVTEGGERHQVNYVVVTL